MAENTQPDQSSLPTGTGTVTAPSVAAKGGGGVAAAGSDGIVIDKNKSAEQYSKEAEAKYIIPRLVRDKFPDLVKLIYETESMNEEEREYWMQIMPIMTEEQIVKFRDILVNEKVQLEKLDKEYAQEMTRVGQRQVPEFDEAKMKEKMAEIKKEEKAGEEKEKTEEEALLQQLKNIGD